MKSYLFLQHLSVSPLRFIVQNQILDYLKINSNCLDLTRLLEFLKFNFSEFSLKLDEIYNKSQNCKLILNQEVSFIHYGENSFPRNLRLLEDPPWVLSYIGTCPSQHSKTLSVVGSREPTNESCIWIEQHLTEIFGKEIVSVSGGARGIDQLTHKVSIRNQKPTLVFLPSGINQIYPHSLVELLPFILLSGGAIISEFPPDQPMRKYSFAFRNRLIAALSDSLLVVEAQERSGSLMTGHIGLALGKNVLTLPAHPNTHRLRGNLELMTQGANFVCSAQDVINYLN